jgi:hypothetical protein
MTKKQLQEEIDKINEFLELIGQAHIYDFWKDGLISTEQILEENTPTFEEIE